MRQGREFFEVSGQRWWRRRDRSTQWAVHTGRGFELPVIPSHVHHFHAATSCTNHLHAARLDNGGCNGRTQKQREPHQHQFGDEFGAAQGMHIPIMTKVGIGIPPKSLDTFHSAVEFLSYPKSRSPRLFGPHDDGGGASVFARPAGPQQTFSSENSERDPPTEARQNHFCRQCGRKAMRRDSLGHVQIDEFWATRKQK